MDVSIGARPMQSYSDFIGLPQVPYSPMSISNSSFDETSLIVLCSPLTDLILVTDGGFYPRQCPVILP